MASDDPMTDSEMDEDVCFWAWVEADWQGGFWAYQRKYYPKQWWDPDQGCGTPYEEMQEGRRGRQSLRTKAIADLFPAIIVDVLAGYDGERASWELTENDEQLFSEYTEYQIWQAVGGRDVDIVDIPVADE
jgi:hypothetical protein